MSSSTESPAARLVGNEAAAAQTDAGTVSAVTALAVNLAVSDYLAQTGITLTGAGEKIGILSDSFNLEGEEASDIADGALPPAADIHIIKEGPQGSADEGRAMAEEVHAIAPGAQIYFYTAVDSESDFANGIATLAADGCDIIVDDVSYEDEPFYQNSGTITQAVEAAIAGGVSYFTAAGNQSNNFYEAAFNAMSFALPGIGTELTNDVAGGSPYEAVSLPANAYLDLTLQWTQPYGGAQYDIGVGLYSFNGTSYTLVRNFVDRQLGGDPVLSIQTFLRNQTAGTYYLAFYESSATPGAPAPGTFKIISFEDSDATIDGAGSGTGSGTSIGHELAPGANTVAAVNINETPAAGVSVPVVESYSSAGPGETYYNAGGTLLATPVVDGTPQFAATDGSSDDVFGVFDGTSAAAPNAGAVALLMLQADSRLAPSQVTYLLERSAISTGDAITGGAGLIQADTAVAGAYTAATTPIWTGQDGTLWAQGLDWSDSIVPGAADAARITDGDGIFSGAYEVMFGEASAAIGALIVDGGVFTPASPDLQVLDGDTLRTGGLTLGRGTIDVFGSLNDTGNFFTGSATGEIYLEPGSELRIAGTAGAAAIDFSGTGGDLQLGAAAADAALAISGFAAGDLIDLSGLAPSLVGTVTVSGGTVSVLGTLDQRLAALQISGDFQSIDFASDGAGGTILYAACFAAGTRILKASGALVPVEALRVGDHVAVCGGGSEGIIWIGRRTIRLSRHPRPELVQPVLIAAGALADGVPARDLLVSPDHAFYLNGCLIPAKALLNGFTIRQVNRKTITYYHVELPRHAVLFAEGAAAESYLETGNRGAFENSGGALTLHPDFAQGLRGAKGCAPFAEHGPAVEAARQGILDRAAIETTDDPAASIAYENGAAYIESRAAIPGEISADPRDRRCLGIKIAELRIGGAEIPLDHAALSEGWHAPEADGRWTNGRAVIPPPLARLGQVEISLAACLRYPRGRRLIGGIQRAGV